MRFEKFSFWKSAFERFDTQCIKWYQDIEVTLKECWPIKNTDGDFMTQKVIILGSGICKGMSRNGTEKNLELNNKKRQDIRDSWS